MPADRNFYEYHVRYFTSYHQVVSENSFFDTLFETNQSKKKTIKKINNLLLKVDKQTCQCCSTKKGYSKVYLDLQQLFVCH